MLSPCKDRRSERGGAGVKLLLVALVVILAANAGYNYVPVAYNGANFRQEMDTAVVKGLAAPGQIKPLEVVKSSITRAAFDNNIPSDAYVNVRADNGVVSAQVVYTKRVGLLPFGLYDYNYNFDYTARPTGYLLKQ